MRLVERFSLVRTTRTMQAYASRYFRILQTLQFFAMLSGEGSNSEHNFVVREGI